MSKARGTWLLAVGLCQLVAGGAFAQERVAQLSTVSGDVTIARVSDGSVDAAKQMGPRVRNGSVFAGDRVATAANSTATLVFSDGSQIELKPKTQLSVREVDLRALMASGKKAKPFGRTIKILAGDVLAKVIPNPEIATEFETPSGVAAVKGTTLAISVGTRLALNR